MNSIDLCFSLTRDQAEILNGLKILICVDTTRGSKIAILDGNDRIVKNCTISEWPQVVSGFIHEISDSMRDDYVSNDGLLCPYCSSTNIEKDTEQTANEDYNTNQMYCNLCHRSHTPVYGTTMIGVV